MEHVWEAIVFKNGPAMKCKTCLFIWQPHMHKPKVTCDEIICSNLHNSTVKKMHRVARSTMSSVSFDTN